MPTLSIVKSTYQGLEVNFTEDGWFNATAAAIHFGKKPIHWLSLDSTKEYISMLSEILKGENSSLLKVKCENSSHLNTRNVGDLIKTKSGRFGGGTWFHPKLAIPFARWLDVRFAIWCDCEIDNLMRGTHPHYDWKRIRHEATSSYKVMSAVLQLVRQNNGKSTAFFHYANEAKLVNWVITGEFKPLDRDRLTYEELDLLAKLEERNSVLVGCGLCRDERKMALSKFVSEFKAPIVSQLSEPAQQLLNAK